MRSTRALLALTVTVVAWASAFVAIRAALRGYPATSLTALRLMLASGCLVLVAAWRRRRLPERRDLPRIVVCGLLGMALYQLLLNLGERSVDAGMASLLILTAPIHSALLAIVVLGEKVPARRWIGILTAFAGAALIALAGAGERRLTVGALYVLIAAAAHGSYHVAHKPLLRRYNGLEVTTYVTCAGALLAVPLVPAVPGDIAQAPLTATMAVVFLAVVPSAVGFVTWAYAVAVLPVAQATASLYSAPVIAIVLGWLLLDEAPRAESILGGMIVLAGVVVANTSTRRTDTEPSVSPAPPSLPSHNTTTPSMLPAGVVAPSSPPQPPRS